MIRVPTICGSVEVQTRGGIGQAETCTLYRNTNDLSDLGVYRHRRITYTLTGGTFWEDYLFADLTVINGVGTCAYPVFTTNVVPGYDYGDLISTVEVFDTAVDPASIMSAAEGNIAWGGWTSYDPILHVGKSSIHTALDPENYGLFSASASKTGPTEPIEPEWRITAAVGKSQIRCRLFLPLACQVVFEKGTKGPEDDEYTFEEQDPVFLSTDEPEHTFDVDPTTADTLILLRLKRIIYHPYGSE